MNDPSAAAIASFVTENIDAAGHTGLRVDATTLDAGAIVDGDTTDPSVADMVDVVSAADALVLCTVLVKHDDAGLTKSLLELLPDGALAGIPVVVIAIGDDPSGVDERPRSINSTVRSLGGYICAPAVHVSEFDITRHTCAVSLEEEAERWVLQSLAALTAGLDGVSSRESAECELIDAACAAERVRGGALLLDVRSNPMEGVGLLHGGVHVQKSDIQTVFSDERGAPSLVERSRSIVVVCNSEHGSHTPARQLSALGFTDVAHVEGGATELAREIVQRVGTPLV